MNDTADMPVPDDDDLAAAAAAALRQRNRIKSILDEALDTAAMSMLAEMLGENDEVGERFATSMWQVLEDRLDPDDRTAAIAELLEPLAEKRARELNADFHARLSRTPEIPHPLGSQEGRRV